MDFESPIFIDRPDFDWDFTLDSGELEMSCSSLSIHFPT